jgi:oligoendopeptidase F
MNVRTRVSFAGALDPGAGAQAASAVALGPLPEWRLDDLYDGMDSPRFAADLDRAASEAKRFAAA